MVIKIVWDFVRERVVFLGGRGIIFYFFLSECGFCAVIFVYWAFVMWYRRRWVLLDVRWLIKKVLLEWKVLSLIRYNLCFLGREEDNSCIC